MERQKEAGRLKGLCSHENEDLTSFETRLTSFALYNTKTDVLQNVRAALFHALGTLDIKQEFQQMMNAILSLFLIQCYILMVLKYSVCLVYDTFGRLCLLQHIEN